MISLRPLLIPVLAGIMTVPVCAAQREGRGAAKRAPAPKVQGRPQGRGNGQAAKKQQPDNRPGQQLFEQLTRMTPEQREKVLSSLPPERRARIEQRIQNWQNLPPAQKTRALFGLERLDNLPPQRRNQVRRSLAEFQDLPEDRRAAISQEIQRMTPMTEAERGEHMNSEDFRNRYSPAEQQMMSNIATVLPSDREP